MTEYYQDPERAKRSKRLEESFEMDYVYPGQYDYKRMTEPLTELEEFFKNTFEKFFPDAKVKLIKFEKFEPHYGIDYFRMIIIYSLGARLNVRKISDFERYMIKNLEEELNEERFPLVSCIEYNEYLENTPIEYQV